MRFIFIKDKFNKYSIRAISASFEKHFDFPYEIISVEALLKSKIKNSAIFCSFNSLNKDFYFQLANKLINDNILICGGPHPSARSDECLNYFHSVCVGEGEITIKEIVNDLLKNSLKKIYKQNILTDLNEFSSYPKKHHIFGPIEITRGCLFNCHYCQTPKLFKGKIRHKNIESIAVDVEFAYKNKKTDFRFITPDAGIYQYNRDINLTEIETLFKTIKLITNNNGRIFFGSFPSELNPFHVNEDLIKLMKYYCSNKRVVIGLQTASERLLKIINRPTDLIKVEKVINLFLKYGFGVDVDFIFGLPEETDNDIEKSINWIEKWSSKVRVHAHYFMPLPGSFFENKTPTQISDKSLKKLKSLEGKGKIFGMWIKQMEYSKNFLNKKTLCDYIK
ncbi:TIGR04013 family B12-binding domain/radical SAM domain-containing protein [Deferribacter thermophilus]|uniref:TIGR04013 family B12-binding domain/radical SAM domain-containing protein n=1 Tax=Deferribacter thermophilus TaxID=53573 RepID=UPI003C2A4CD2